MRILLGPANRICDVDLAQERDCALGCVACRKPAVSDLSLGDLASNRQDRIEGGGRVLENEPDLLSPHVPELLGIGADDLGSAENNRAADPSGCRKEAGDRQRSDTLAGSRFPDDAENFVSVDVEIDATHNRHRVVASPEGDLQSAYGEDRSGHADAPWRCALLAPLKV